jgi:hypothetical protein
MFVPISGWIGCALHGMASHLPTEFLFPSFCFAGGFASSIHDRFISNTTTRENAAQSKKIIRYGDGIVRSKDLATICST